MSNRKYLYGTLVLALCAFVKSGIVMPALGGIIVRDGFNVDGMACKIYCSEYMLGFSVALILVSFVWTLFLFVKVYNVKIPLLSLFSLAFVVVMPVVEIDHYVNRVISAEHFYRRVSRSPALNQAIAWAEKQHDEVRRITNGNIVEIKQVSDDVMRVFSFVTPSVYVVDTPLDRMVIMQEVSRESSMGIVVLKTNTNYYADMEKFRKNINSNVFVFSCWR